MGRRRRRRDGGDAVCRTACDPAPASKEGMDGVAEGPSGNDHARQRGPGAGEVVHSPSASMEAKRRDAAP